MPFKKGEMPKGGVPFKKGQSGNPKGKPVGARHALSKERLLKILSVVQNKKNPLTQQEEQLSILEQMDISMILKALKGSYFHYKELVERIEGKVTDKTEVTGANGGPVETETVIKIGYGNKKL